MQNTFVVSPMSQNITLDPGQVYNGSITVANPATATSDFHYKVSVSPYSVSGTDYKPDFQTQSDWSRIVDWFKIENASGTLKPNESKQIKFTITVPSDALAGGQYAMIGVSSDDHPESGDNAMVQNVFEMASLVFANVSGNVVRSGEILKNYVPGFVATGEPTVEVSFSNTGNIHEVATTKLTVKNVVTGETVLPKEDHDAIYETTVMPDSTRTFFRAIDEVAALGIYEVKQDINYLGEDSSTSTIMIVCPIWFVALVIFTISSIIAMIVYSRVLRKKRFSKKESTDFDEKA
ncbi:hypothetical protein IKF84_02540 [Candidatus Saccharibacteria bacterium]|nr:hypothetical protein [Candidatus Saccharibacteria bacterium]